MRLLALILVLQSLIQPILATQADETTAEDVRARLDSLDDQRVLLEFELAELQEQIEAIRSESDSLKWRLTRIRFADAVDEGVFVETTHMARIKTEPHVFSAVVEVIPKATELMVLDYHNGYWKVSYSGKLGYVHEAMTNTNRQASTVRRFPRRSQAWVASTVVDVRTAPEIDSEVAARLGKGEFVHVVRDSSDWLEIAFGESQTNTGWIHKGSTSWKRVLKP